MSDAPDTSRPRRLREFVGSGSADGTLVIGYALLAGAVLITTDVGGLLRTALALPIILFLPGYALVSFAFPGRGTSSETDARSPVQLLTTGAPGWYERLALSVAITLTLLPLVGLVLATTRWGFSGTAVVAALGAVVIGVMAAAVVRRVRLPVAERFHSPDIAGLETVIPDDRPREAVVNVVVLISVLLAMGALAYGLVAPQPDVSSTEIQLLTETEDGDLVAGGYPDAIPPGESAPLTVAVSNDGTEASTYTVVVEAEHVQADGDELTVLDDAELARLQLDVEPGERGTRETVVSPPIAGENIRLNYYLYENEPPADPDPETADDHLWITVEGV